MIETLIKELKSKLDEIKTQIPEAEFAEQMQWARDEYRNYMVVGRDKFTETLDWILAKHYSTKVFVVLRENIDKYGATKAFYQVACEYKKPLREMVTMTYEAKDG
jgi:hypothetical protein